MIALLQLATTADEHLSSIGTPLLDYVKALLILGGVLLLAWGTLRFGMPYLFRMHTPADGPIKVLARYTIEPRKTLYLVKVGSQVFLLGTSERQIEYLTEVMPENAMDLQGSDKREGALTVATFRQILRHPKKRDI